MLAEDVVLVREGLARILEFHGREVVARVGAAVELVAATRKLAQDPKITQVRMPPGNSDEGLRAALEPRPEQPDLPVLVLSQYVEQTYTAELLGAESASVGYLLKDRASDVETWPARCGRVAAGGTVIDPQVVRQLLARNRERPALARLTERERRVVDLMAQGSEQRGDRREPDGERGGRGPAHRHRVRQARCSTSSAWPSPPASTAGCWRC
ncbi:two component transcriptional regulator, LuxR family [Streptoalloteichus tenebrarius]|uniref:Two component transcriptional regulator, LuxR family n=1 Tax=Streptoalloteichus tenebrarius (strain ATCC 17920 / DSM 40477 / JCM 4838 / CBS 697.72 / NBRC 16177 / NCIMB 11028 / NRRL B-12390 / A12253. 1 / ISP 5477) TaxID=1933 RepID=A0ABT1HNY1_STRSD|nr:response regulator transcription factor [Streptoalloteichus tenebrarius]MCP2257195.1 two component transcriptional regulator, LuxR family [Streptoalloteichus tenebrarius]BFE98828.1 response regulator transcription factor [Streptoalloteichus tenebrarius]